MNKISDNSILVSIKCAVYNHEPYLRQCLEGFVMQKTNFQFEAIVHDDASTDGSATIIREYAEKYPDIIKPIYETENQYSKRDGSLSRIMNAACKGKYIAVCEGDDYWIDPLKLQKQVDFLEENPDYGLVHTYFHYVDVHDKIIPPPTQFHLHIQERIFDGYIWDYYLYNPGFIMTCTCMFRRSLYREEEQTFLDTGIFMMIARQSKVHCIREITSCYRRNPQGAMCSNHDYVKARNKRVKLYQVYYYIDNKPCAHFYKNNKNVNKALGIAYVNLLQNMSMLSKEEKMMLLKIIHTRPSILLEIPAVIFKKVIAKVHCRKSI